MLVDFHRFFSTYQIQHLVPGNAIPGLFVDIYTTGTYAEYTTDNTCAQVHLGVAFIYQYNVDCVV